MHCFYESMKLKAEIKDLRMATNYNTEMSKNLLNQLNDLHKVMQNISFRKTVDSRSNEVFCKSKNLATNTEKKSTMYEYEVIGIKRLKDKKPITVENDRPEWCQDLNQLKNDTTQQKQNKEKLDKSENVSSNAEVTTTTEQVKGEEPTTHCTMIMKESEEIASSVFLVLFVTLTYINSEFNQKSSLHPAGLPPGQGDRALTDIGEDLRTRKCLIPRLIKPFERIESKHEGPEVKILSSNKSSADTSKKKSG